MMRRSMKRRLRSALVSLVVLLWVGQAQAHEPNVLGEAPFEVENPKISYALYGTFEEGDEVFEVRLSYEEPFALPFEILVPRQDKWRDHRPMYAVVGPGLAEPTAEELELLPRELPEGAGLYLERHDLEDRPVIFESFTRRVFWSSGPIALRLEAGDYQIWIWSPEGTTGDFTIGFGVEEGGNFLQAFSNWRTYAY